MFEVIKHGFSLDKDLIEKWHIESGNGLDACVQRTCDDLVCVDESFEFLTYKDIGFFGIEFGSYVNTIFVYPKYRTKEHMGPFWEFVRSKVSSPFYTSLYKKNTPAISFYQRNGGKIIEELEDRIVLEVS